MYHSLYFKNVKTQLTKVQVHEWTLTLSLLIDFMKKGCGGHPK